ncbi:conserved protein of unknown function [Pararobbsia alpina]
MKHRSSKKPQKKSVRAATHVRVAIAVRAVMAKVAVRVNAVVVRAAALAPTRSLENKHAATETQKVS